MIEIKSVRLDGEFLHQWDKGRSLLVTGFEEGTLVDFVFNLDSEAVPSKVQQGAVSIPNQVLTTAGVLIADFYVDAGSTGSTVFKHNVYVTPRVRPADYVYEPTEVLTWTSLDARLKVLETLGLPKFDASYEQKILYVVDGVVTPLALGPGLVVRTGVLYVTGASPEEREKPVGAVTAEVVDGDLRIYLDDQEVAPVVDAAGDLTWPGLLLTVDADGNGTLTFEEV